MYHVLNSERQNEGGPSSLNRERLEGSVGLAEASAALVGHWLRRGLESTLRCRKRASLVWVF